MQCCPNAYNAQTPYDMLPQHRLLVFVPSILPMTLNLHNLRLPLVIHYKRRQLASTNTPAIQAKREFLQIQSPLPVVPIHDAHALVLVLLLLLMVPVLLPWCAIVLRAGYTCLEINGAHVHNMEGVLLFEGYVWYETSVNNCEFAEIGDVANA